MVKMETEKNWVLKAFFVQSYHPWDGTSLCYPGNPEPESSKAISMLSVGEAKPLSICSVARPVKFVETQQIAGTIENKPPES